MLTTKNVNRDQLSPMLLQYVEIKDEYPNDIVLLHVGKFFESYFEDAVHVSSFGDIRLTSKKIGIKKDKKLTNKDDEEIEETDEASSPEEIINSEMRIPLSGFPHKNLRQYAQKIIATGKRVVIAEELEDPKTVKNRLVNRGVVKIISSIEKDDDYLSSFANNYLCVIYKGNSTIAEQYGICFADVYTSEIFLTTVNSFEALLNEIARYKPNELVLTTEMNNLLGSEIEKKLKLQIMRTIEERVFVLDNPIKKVLNCFKLKNADKIGFHSELEMKSLCVLINYVEYTEQVSLNFDSLPTCYDFNNYMSIDRYSSTNLELTESLTNKSNKGTLFSVLNKSKTGMGSRLLKQWIDKPLLDKEKIEERLDGISELLEDVNSLLETHGKMYGILDISRIIGRLKLNNSIPKDLVNLRESLKRLPAISNSLEKFKSNIFKSLFVNMDTFEDLTFLLDKALLDDPISDIKEGDVLKSGYNQNLDRARDMILNSNKYLNELEQREREKTGIKNLRLSNVTAKCSIEVPKSSYDKVPNYYRVEKALKQSTRYVTDETERLEKDLYGAMEQSKTIEIELYEELKSSILLERKKLLELANILANLDVLCGLAETAIENNYTCPIINNDGFIKIIGGRHPVVEKNISDTFVANNTELDMKDNNFILLTGPNMGGKSTYMRQIALITIMSHIGSFVPADYANISITDKVFTRIGASDDIASGNSTFKVEMIEVQNILNNVTPNSLVLLDEVGRGTSTSDGLSLAQSISEYIYNNIGCKTLFATHYHELINLENTLPGLKNYHMSVEKNDDSLNFIRKLEAGGVSESYGIDVAQMAGLPSLIISRATEILKTLEANKQNENNIPRHQTQDALREYIKNIDKANLSPVSAYKLVFDLIDLATPSSTIIPHDALDAL